MVVHRTSARLDAANNTLAGTTTILVRNPAAHSLTLPSLHIAATVTLTGSGGADSALRGVTVAPGDSLILSFGWHARPQSMQAGGGTTLAFTDWYPRLPLFGTVVLALDVPLQEIVTASGVALCGDPGWSANGRPGAPAPVLDRNQLGSAIVLLDHAGLTGACDTPPAGHKVLVWYAERVPMMGLVLATALQYEEGDIFRRPVRVLYRSGWERTWGAGFVSRRSETALAWLYEIFGAYPWAPTSTLQGAPPPGDVPMLVWSDTASQERILHGFGHQYTGLILSPAPADWWLDEGLNRFQVSWFHDAQGRKEDYARLERRVLDWELDGRTRSIAGGDVTGRGPPPADSVEADSIATARSELFFHQLRGILGDDRFRTVLRSYYARDSLKSVNEQEFRSVAESVAGRDLTTLFRQWLHESVPYDFRVAAATRQPLSGGRWRTTVEVEAVAPGIQPVQVWVIAGRDTVVKQTVGRERRERLQIETSGKPRRVIVDPLGRGHDWNLLNNQRTFGFHFFDILVGRDRPRQTYLDTYFTRQTRRDRLTVGIAPTVWFNDPGGWTIGLRRRDDYLGRFLLNQFYLTQSLGAAGTDHLKELNASFDVRDPPSWHAPGWHQRVAGAWVEGRSAASLGVERSRTAGLFGQVERAVGVSLDWLTVASPRWVDRKYYDDAGTVELKLQGRVADTLGSWQPRISGTLAGGYQYTNDQSRPVRDEVYGRGTLEAVVRSQVARLHFGARVYAGLALGKDAVVRQRAIYLSGADPYEQWRSPFLRTRGALFVRDGMNYTDPGGAGARGLDPHLAARQAYGLNFELELDLVQRPGGGLANRVALAAFADAVAADGDLDPDGRNRMFGAGDAGAGLRLDHRIGKTTFQTRLDLPLWVSRPELAQDQGPGAQQSGWRWTFSFAPAF